MTPRLVLLGTGTCQLEPDRAASSALIELPETRVIFDFGRGVANRLTELNLRQDQIGDVVLSHFHVDHLSDLVSFIHAGLYSLEDPRRADLNVHGAAGVEGVIQTLLTLIGLSELSEAPFRVVARKIEGRLEIGDWLADYLPLPPAGNHGLRFQFRGRSYALTGDSHFHDQLVEFLRGVDLAVIDSGHLDEAELVELALRSAAATLVCSHLYRDLDVEALNSRARRGGFQGRFLLGRDRMAFAL